MTGTRYRQPEGLADFADELRLLAEVVLERVEPALREAAAEGRPEWSNCTWCPLCAAAALLRGEQHEVLTAVATHGTAIVTVLREALAGVPVDPIVRHEHGRAHDHQAHDRDPAHGTRPDPGDRPAAAGTAHPNDPTASDPSGSAEPASRGEPADESGTGRDGTDPGGPSARATRSGKSGGSRYVGIPVNIEP